MKKDTNHIDELFKGAIEQHRENPSADVWENIDSRLDKKKVAVVVMQYKRLKWAAAALLIFSIGMAMYAMHTNVKNDEIVKRNNIDKAEFSNTNESVANIDGKDPVTPLTNKQPGGDGIDRKSNNEKDANRKQVDDDSKAPIIEDNINKPIGDNLLDQIVKGSQEQPTANHVSPQSGKTALKEASYLAKSTDDLIQANHSVGMYNRNFVVDNVKAAINVQNGVARLNNDFKNMLKIVPENLIANTSPDLSAKSTLLTDGTTGSENKISRAKVLRHKKQLSVAAFFSPDFASMNIKSNMPRFREDDLKEIRKNEQLKVSSTFGALVSYRFTRQWSVESGLTISTRISDIRPKNIFARPDHIGNIMYRSSSSAGYYFFDVKTGAQPIAGDSIKALFSTNTLQYIGVPLAVVYDLPLGKISLQPTIGISANFFAKGSIETTISTPAGQQKARIDDIRGLKSAYMSGSLGLGLAYNVSRNVDLNLRPNLRFALSSINGNAPVKTYLNFFGLSAGVKVSL